MSLRLERAPELASAEFVWAPAAGDAAALSPESDQQLNLQLEEAVLGCLSRGPSKFYPVVGARIVLESVRRSPASTSQGVVVAVADAMRKLLARVGTEVLEPWMRLEVTASPAHTSTVLGDLRFFLSFFYLIFFL